MDRKGAGLVLCARPTIRHLSTLLACNPAPPYLEKRLGRSAFKGVGLRFALLLENYPLSRNPARVASSLDPIS